MSPLEAFGLGTIQGLTEFLPVSSSGHLVLGQWLLGIRVEGIGFEIAVHVATLLSVLLVYRDRARWLIAGTARGQGAAWRYGGLIILASVPAGLVGVFLRDEVERLFESPWPVGVGFLLTAGILLSSRTPLARDAGSVLTPRIALLIGLAQAAAIIPGVSRSGATVVTGLWLGLPALEAAAFSFLMSVPAILGAAVLQVGLSGGGEPGPPGGLTAPLVGGVAAAVFGVIAIRVFVRMLEERTFPRFAYYVGGLGVLVLSWTLFR